MSATHLLAVCTNQAAEADHYGDADLIAVWRERAATQQHTNP